MQEPLPLPVAFAVQAARFGRTPRSSVDIVVTPLYWRRLDWHPDRLGQEETPEAYARARKDAEGVGPCAPAARVGPSNVGDTYHRGLLVGVPEIGRGLGVLRARVTERD